MLGEGRGVASLRREMWRSVMAHPPNSRPLMNPAFPDPGPDRDELSPHAASFDFGQSMQSLIDPVA